MTLADVAQAAQISVPYLSQIERGLRLPGLDVVYKLTDALGVSAGSLLD